MSEDIKKTSPSEKILSSRRDFLRRAGIGAGAVAGSTLAAPYVSAQTGPIKWRLQTYSGAPWRACDQAADRGLQHRRQRRDGDRAFLRRPACPDGRPFPRHAVRRSRCGAVRRGDDGLPVDISVFGGYFPFATRYPLDVTALFRYYGLKEIWEEAYSEVENVTWLSTGSWDPLHIFTVDKPIRSLADMNGLRVFGVPTAGKFLSKYGLIPVTIPWDNVEVAMQTGEIDGVAWCGFTEAYEVGWADVCNYALNNAVTGAWFGSYFANTESWNKVPADLQELFRMSIDQSHYYRLGWYWGGEAKLRVEGEKMELTQLPAEEWAQVVKDAEGFWDEVSASSPRSAKVVDAFKAYATNMEKAGYPYR